MKIRKPLDPTLAIIAAIGVFLLAIAQFAPQHAHAQNIPQLEQWTSTSSPSAAITQRVYNKAIKITGLATGQCLTLDSNKILTTTSCGSGGGGGLASSTPWTAGYLTYVVDNGTIRGVATTTLTASGALSLSQPISVIGASPSVLTITDAAADGTTKGAASFTAADFNASSGNISIDYTNGQAAASGVKGFLTGTDWDTFNNKVAGTRTLTVAGTANQITSSAGAQDLSANRTWTLSLPNHVIFPSSFQVTNATTTNATTTGSAYFTGVTASKILQLDSNNKLIPLTVGTGLSFDGTTLSASGGSGITAIGPTGQTQTGSTITFATSTTGTDFTITGSGNTITFNAPTASASNRGFLSSTDWSTFNNKLSSAVQTLVVPQGSFSGNLTLATSTNTTNGITSRLMISGSGSTLTFSSDQTGILTVPGGGTGWGNIQAGAIPYGNGTGALATTTQGTGGQVLAWLNGIPTWTATTTAGTGLTYSGGALNVNTSQNISTLSNLTSNGAILTSGGTGALGIYTGASCTNQFIRSLSGSIAATCATVGAADVSLANLTATDSSLTFSGTYNGSTARTIGLNLGNANTWTALQSFANASTSLESVTKTGYFGSTATTTINADGKGSITMPATSVLTLGTTTAGTLKTSSSGVVYADTAAAGGASVNVQVFTSTGANTYTPTAGTRYITVEVQAGGGAGGADVGNPNGGGGGGGGYAKKTIAAAQLTGTLTATVGAAGSNSTFTYNSGGTTITANAGSAGGTGGGAGGTASGGDVNIPGGGGGPGFNTATTQNFGGAGGNSVLGIGGAPAKNTSAAATVAGNPGGNYGAGGGGAVAATDGNPQGGTGGAGAQGIIIITEYY